MQIQQKYSERSILMTNDKFPFATGTAGCSLNHLKTILLRYLRIWVENSHWEINCRSPDNKGAAVLSPLIFFHRIYFDQCPLLLILGLNCSKTSWCTASRQIVQLHWRSRVPSVVVWLYHCLEMETHFAKVCTKMCQQFKTVTNPGCRPFTVRLYA